MNLVTETIALLVGIGLPLLLYYSLKDVFSDNPIQESNQSTPQPVNASDGATVPDIKEKTVYRTRPYKEYSYNGGSVKRSHRFYSGDLHFINEIAKSRNVYSSDVVNSMIGYFVENPELVNAIAPDFKKDKPIPVERKKKTPPPVPPEYDTRGI